MSTDQSKLPETENTLFRCIKNFVMSEGEIIAFTEGKEYEASPWHSDGVMFSNDQGTPHVIASPFLVEYFVNVKKKAREVEIVEAFIKLCIESMTPHLFDVLVDEIVPALEKYRHIAVRSVEELGREMGIK